MGSEGEPESGLPDWPINGNRYSSLAELFAVKEVPASSNNSSDDVEKEIKTFESIHPAYSPGNIERAFGGHVYAQAVVAAAKTVQDGFAVHSITGTFLLLATTAKSFIYQVSTVRSGSSYAQRRVDVLQDPKRGPVFTAVVSFKLPEPSPVTCTKHDSLQNKYATVLNGRTIESWPEAPGVDSPFWWEVEAEYGVGPFPGLEMRKVDMTPFNNSHKVLDRIQLQYYRAIGPVPSVSESAALHAAGHLYASDRNGLFTIPNFLGSGDAYSSIASLSHTVVFHGEASDYDMLDAEGKPKWFCIEAAIEHISHGRCMVTGKLWDLTKGVPVATYMQDGMVRMKEGVQQSLDKESIFFAEEGEDKSEDRLEKEMSRNSKMEKL